MDFLKVSSKEKKRQIEGAVKRAIKEARAKGQKADANGVCVFVFFENDSMSMAAWGVVDGLNIARVALKLAEHPGAMPLRRNKKSDL